MASKLCNLVELQWTVAHTLTYLNMLLTVYRPGSSSTHGVQSRAVPIHDTIPTPTAKPSPKTPHPTCRCA